MSGNDSHLQQDLIAYAMGLMEADERSAFEARLDQSPELRRELDALSRALSPLDAWSAPGPDAAFVDEVMGRVETASPLTYVAESVSIPPESTGRPMRRPLVTLPEFFALAACIALFLSVYFPVMSDVKDGKQLAQCNVHQASLFRGLEQYASAYDGNLPRVDDERQTNWLDQRQRRHWTPIIQGRFVAPRHLYCSTTGERYDEETIRENIEAFLQRADVRFFNVQHPGNGGSRLRIEFRMPLGADPNPMFNGASGVDDAGHNANSPAHGGRGQNVLFNDGSVKFLETPLLESHDNIWRPEILDSKYKGTETPQSATDSFLIP